MRFLSHAAAALLIGAAAPAALVAPAIAQTCVCPLEGAAISGPIIEAPEPPPPLPEYEQPPLPAPGYHWTPGYWAWNNVDYYWVPGAWVEPPRVGVLWTPPYWGFVAGVFLFHPGYWAPHVGFYGGINYGFGYGGTGYEGGRWENGQFFYNGAANNFGSTPVTRVYNQPITINNTSINRVSYNGGPGGLQIKPAPAQEQVMAEPRIQATPAQVSQVRAASVDAQQFKSENQGKPPVAATPRPGEFRGPGVVPAKAAGAARAAPAPAQNPSPRAEEKLAPGGKPLPGAATPPGGKPLRGVLSPAAGQTLPGEKPLTTQPPNAPEKRPAGEKPMTTESLKKPEEKLPAAEKPHGSPARDKVQEKLPPGTERGGASKSPALEKPKRLEKPQGPGKPVMPESPKTVEKPQGLMKPAPGPKPVVPAMSGGPPRLETTARPALAPNALPKGPSAAAERKAPPPREKPRECGRPGLPPCPK